MYSKMTLARRGPREVKRKVMLFITTFLYFKNKVADRSQFSGLKAAL